MIHTVWRWKKPIGYLRVRNGAEYVDLNPQYLDTRRRQHEMARQARLYSESYGDEPERRVRILRAN